MHPHPRQCPVGPEDLAGSRHGFPVAEIRRAEHGIGTGSVIEARHEVNAARDQGVTAGLIKPGESAIGGNQEHLATRVEDAEAVLDIGGLAGILTGVGAAVESIVVSPGTAPLPGDLPNIACVIGAQQGAPARVVVHQQVERCADAQCTARLGDARIECDEDKKQEIITQVIKKETEKT